MSQYLDAIQWYTTHHVQGSTVDTTNVPDTVTDELPAYFEMMERTHVFDANLQKEFLLEYKRDSKNKSQEYTKFLADKKALIRVIFRQCDETTKTKISLGATYAANRQAGRLIEFRKQLCTVCFSSDDGDLSYAPYKEVVAVKSTNNFSNSKSYDPHGYKAEVKIKYNSVKAITGKIQMEQPQ